MNILNSERRVVSDELKSGTMHRWLRTCTNPKSQIPNPKSSRRGILLLVVLSMLTLFLMIGMAYLVSANHYRKTNKTMAQASITSYLDIDRGALLEQALLQLVRDTGNQFSSIRFHSLLRDMYGNDGFIGTTDNVYWAGDELGPNMEDVTNRQMVTLELGTTIKNLLGIEIDLNVNPLSVVKNAYNGLTLTFLDGASEGLTTRIVGYRSPNWFTVLAVPQADGSTLTTPGDLAGSRILVNGRPFNGTGVGYDSTPAGPARLSEIETVNVLDASMDPRTITGQIGLMPNATFFDILPAGNVDPSYYNLATSPLPSQRFYAGIGGSDESYDAADFQNMALALMPVAPIDAVMPSLDDITPISAYFRDVLPPGLGDSTLGNMVLPSFHRPALLNYWLNKSPEFGGGEPELYQAESASFLRKVLLRPNWHDHPNFTGSNPEYAQAISALNVSTNPQDPLLRMIYGPWDVDNDNDGVRDGMWTDIGSPVMAGPDGRLVKPLVSFLVLDLDGRVNVNAHGTLEHLGTEDRPIPERNVAGEQNLSSLLPQGQGYGPADISLRPLFNNNILENILLGTNTGMAGRYGHDVPGDRFKSRPGDNSNFDMKAQLKMQGVPRWANARDTMPSDYMLSAYVTPPDFHGRYRLGINDFGQPVYEAQFDGVELEQDSPYEMDLSPGGSRGESVSSADAPYSLAELERLLRAYDVDAGTLPSRLWDFSLNGATTPDPAELAKWRALLTTDSYDLPVPNVAVPQWMVDEGPDGVAGGTDIYANVMGKPATNATFADLLEYRVRVGLSITSPPLSVLQQDQVSREMAKLLPQDLADGLRMDINRPFGNGRDDDDDGVVDEPGEPEGSYWQMRLANGNLTNITDSTDPRAAFTGTGDDKRQYSHIHDSVDRDGNGTIDAVPTDLVLRDNLRRQDMARDLYVLAMTLVDPLPTTATPEQKQARSRQLAQWAINAVDFRDPDNIMTAFEYDENPFDGWGVDGDLTTDDGGLAERDTVWGAERPELVITETLAWHDRRTEDGGEEINTGDIEDASQVGPKKEEDSDFDQEHRPQGAGFVELYNPWPENPAANSDTHFVELDTSSNPNELVDRGVDIARTHDGSPSGSPVWRINVYKTENLVDEDKIGGPHRDPDAVEPDNQAKGADRSIYFTDFDPAIDGDGVAYYRDSTTPVPMVRPGGYFVAGTGEIKSGTEYLSPFGVAQGDELDDPVSRGVVLDTDPNSTRAVSVRLPDDTSAQDAKGFNCDAPASSCAVAVINQPVNFSFSEPPGGYILNGGAQFTSNTTSLDTPLDDQRSGGPGLGGAPADDLTGQSLDHEIRLKLPFEKGGAGVGSEPSARRTIPGFSWIYLQRLANPLLAYDKDTNPYLTVDSMGVNVTVFNGLIDTEVLKLKSAAANVSAEYANFDNGAPNSRDGAFDTFASLQRGRVNRLDSDYMPLPADTSAGKLFKIHETAMSGNSGYTGSHPVDPEPEILDPLMDPPKKETNLWGPELLGRLQVNDYDPNADDLNAPNIGLWRNRAGMSRNGSHVGYNAFNFGAIPDCTLGFLNEPFMKEVAATEVEHKSVPRVPFPWLNWNNRPFISANELMQVPAFRSSQLLQAFAFNHDGAQNENYDAQDSVNEVKLSDTHTLETDGPYGQLANFYRIEEASNKGIAGLYRVLEFLQVPSRFVGTETWLNPTSFGQTVSDTSDPRYQRQPPFNRISSYRDPGRMNLNTIASNEAYFALMHGNPSTAATDVHPGPSWASLQASRRGYGTGGAMLQLDSTMPTFFKNPFRSADAGELVPVGTMSTAEGVNCTMLREGTTPGNPLFVSSKLDPYRNADRNPYFRYQPLTRLDNLTTTRSNVYAVWVTVGFFEVEELTNAGHSAILARFGSNEGTLVDAGTDPLFNKVYPEGYMLGKEAGIDTGDVVRVREFAIIDRSIPVAFEPGADHNVEQVIRLRRRIE